MMKGALPFSGFTPQTIQFLNDLKENNFRQWFEDHRELYEIELLQPFRALANTLTPAMHAIDSLFEFRPHKMISRIYRDTRFSKNKDPYKTCLWLNFQRSKTQWQNFPGFFMELNTETCFYGMGMYEPQRKIIEAFRERIETEPNGFEKMVKKSVEKAGFVVDGEMYKRPLKNNVSNYLQPWVQRKSVYVMKTISVENPIIYSEKLVQQLAEDFMALKELYDFMVGATMDAE